MKFITPVCTAWLSLVLAVSVLARLGDTPGHGRSACFVLAWLLQTRRVVSVEASLDLLRPIHPGAGLGAEQHTVLVAFAADLQLSPPIGRA